MRNREAGDGHSEQVQPWPKWVRYPLIALFAAMVVYGLTVPFHSHVDPVVWRMALVRGIVPVLAALALLLGALLRRARGRRAGHQPATRRHGSVPALDVDRDRLGSPTERRVAAFGRQAVTDVYDRARRLADLLRGSGRPAQAQRIDDALAGGATATEALMALRAVCLGLEELPDAPVAGETLTLRADIDALLGIK